MKTRKFGRRQQSSFVFDAMRVTTAFAVIFAVLVLPSRIGGFTAETLLRFPLELPLIILVLVALSGKLRTVARVLIVMALVALILLKSADIATFFGFGRPFNPFADLLMMPAMMDTLRRARGLGVVIAVAAGALLLIAAFLTVLIWATGAVSRSRDERLSAAAAALAMAALGFTSYATFDTSIFARDRAATIAENFHDRTRFRAELLDDPFRDIPPERRLAGLKDKDVLLIFVESYGRASLDNPAYAPLLRATLRRFEDLLTEKGFSARSAWMMSPTFGGESYLAHSTAVSGLRVDNQQRYVQLVRSDRRTLITDFNEAGWRTIAVAPAITKPWPEGASFGFSKIYSAPELQYKGASFGYITMPDQYALAAFAARELAPSDRQPVMAEIALVSSHIPWAPIPKLVPWEEVGDGSIFNTARSPESADEIWRDPKRIAEYYALSIDYALQAVMSFAATFATHNTLLIIIGDHQPMTFIAGEGASHEVPVHIIARDPALLTALDGGTWSPGLQPDASGPSWPMEDLRERLIKAFTGAPNATPSAQAVSPP